MAVRDYQSLMLPLLRQAATGVYRIADVIPIIADAFELTENDRNAVLTSGRQTVLYNRMHWAKTYLSKAGLLTSPSRGTFTISAAGSTLLAQNPSVIDNKMLSSSPSFLQFIAKKAQTTLGTQHPTIGNTDCTSTADQTPEEVISAAHEELALTLRTELLEEVLRQTPQFFAQLIVDLLIAMGYGGSRADAARRIGGTGDGGIDGIISEDRLGLDQIYLQAKRYAVNSTISRDTVQAFVGSLVGRGATKGVFITTSSFSKHAVEYAENLVQCIVLIDGDRLTSLMIEHGIGVRVSSVIEVKRIDLDFFEPA